jgi:putative oxidoreductase
MIRSISSTRITESQLGIALAVLRVFAGVIFVAHGAQKLFVYGPAAVGQAFGQMGLPLPELMAYGVALAELAGGILLVLGLLTRPVSALLVLVMLGAVFVAHLPAGFFLPDGYEFAMIMGAISASLAIVGAGRYSVDHVLSRG